MNKVNTLVAVLAFALMGLAGCSGHVEPQTGLSEGKLEDSAKSEECKALEEKFYSTEGPCSRLARQVEVACHAMFGDYGCVQGDDIGDYE